MTVYAITGKLGSGKSLVSVGRALDYLRQGRPVATNLNLYLDNFFVPKSKITYTRLPDVPTFADFDALGKAHDSYDENKNGLIVLDECGVFFNSREWNDAGRQAIIKWLLHSRKLGWDVILIVQDISIIDKQIRAALLEHVGICKRTDRFSIPWIGGLLKFFGIPSRPPRVHICSVKYGTEQHSLVVDRWYYRGVVIQNAYDTKQVFSSLNSDSIHSVLSPWHTKGRHLPLSWLESFKRVLSGQLPESVRHKPKHPLVESIRLITDLKLCMELHRKFLALGFFESHCAHPIMKKILRIHNPHLRLKFILRFNEAGSFDAPLEVLSRALRRELVGYV